MEKLALWCNEECQLDCCRPEDSAELVENGSVFQYCEGHLNFATAHNEDDDDYYHKRKIVRLSVVMVTHTLDMLEKQMAYPLEDFPQTVRTRKRPIKPEDPMSHRIIEKRRRDRMNNCLADLSRLIPADYLKKGRGRIEKTEIIEMAIKHMRHLQTIISTTRVSGKREKSPTRQTVNMDNYRLGYFECLSEAMHFLVEIQGFFSGDALCVQMMNHLHRHCDGILKADTLNFPRQRNSGTSSSNCSSSNGTGGSPPLGMSNSVSDDYPACGSESDESQYLHRNYSSSSGVESVGVKEDPEGPSQLRDMLMSQGSHKSDSGYDMSSSEDHHMYKFKNNIQQRYNESRLQTTEEPPLKKLKLQEQSFMGNNRLSFGHKALIARQIPMMLASPKAVSDQKPPRVPAFALHASGECYIPLSLEQHLLAPHLPALMDQPPHKATLHPVTISVNFQQQARSDSKL